MVKKRTPVKLSSTASGPVGGGVVVVVLLVVVDVVVVDVDVVVVDVDVVVSGGGGSATQAHHVGDTGGFHVPGASIARVATVPTGQ
jgi:hypothetical protein